jgi:hypothetical protein
MYKADMLGIGIGRMVQEDDFLHSIRRDVMDGLLAFGHIYTPKVLGMSSSH